MAEIEKLLAAFKKADKEGKGTIGRFQLGEVLTELDEYEWSTHDLFELFEAVDQRNTGQIKYKKFINYLLEGELEDDEDSEDEDDDAEYLAGAEECQEHHLDLTIKITEKAFLMIARRMGESTLEAAEMYSCIIYDCKADGKDVEGGVALEECIDAFGLGPQDHTGLTHLSGIVDDVLAKINAGVEEPDDEDIEKQKKAAEMCMNAALDAIVRHLDLQKRPMEDAWEVVKAGEVPLTKTQMKLLEKFADWQDELVKLVKEFDHNPKMLNVNAGKHANNEHCYTKVGAIIDDCKAKGIMFTDPDFDLTKAENLCLYVDKDKPGYDCTVGKPAGVKRLSEIIGGTAHRGNAGGYAGESGGATLFKGGVRPGDIVQGQIGTCFFLGALGAIAAHMPKSITKCFIKYDIDIGIYGVRFNLGGEWVYEIVDDYVPIDQYGRVLYAKSLDKEELWVALLEKAFCKHHTCYEMCDGGLASEAIFSMFGGASGKMLISKKHMEDPSSFFKAVQHSLQRGWLLTTTFVARRHAVQGQGKCGEAVLPGGLVGGHVYSVLGAVEAGGQQLIHLRNPWGTGEWKGKWSDFNKFGEWTDEIKEACGYQKLNDGKFWMDIADFVNTSGGVDYAVAFAPPYKKISQYKHFIKKSVEATAMWSYKAGADDEIGFQKGQVLEVDNIAPGWWYGHLAGNDSKKGFFPGNYVSLNDRPVSRFDISGITSDIGEEKVMCVVCAVQPNILMKRGFYKRKQDGLNYKETHYPRLQLLVLDKDGTVMFKKTGNKRMLNKMLMLTPGETYKIYPIAADGIGSDFMLRVYVKSGSVTLHEVEGASIEEIKGALAQAAQP